MTGHASFKFMQWAAWRYLIARKGKQGLSLMTSLSILGVVVGVAALIIVLSVMGGFENDLKSKMLRGEPHLEIMAENVTAGFSLNDHPLEEFRKLYPDAEGIAPFTQADVVLKQAKHSNSGVLFGIDPKIGGGLWAFDQSMIDGRIADIGEMHRPMMQMNRDGSSWPGIVLGDGMAAALGADLGDEVTIISPAGSSGATLLSGGTLTRTYVVVGVFHTGLFNYDSKWAVVSLDEGRKFLADYDPSLDEENYVSGVGVNVTNPVDIDKYRDRIKAIPGLSGKTWTDTNSALLFALKLEKYTMGSILLLIVVVAAFSISATMMMTVFHKKQQICLLRALGMSERDIGRLYLFQGFTIGTTGIFGGLVLGLLMLTLLKQLRYADLPVNLVSLHSLPVKFLPAEYGVICIAAWLLSVLGAYYPAKIAARQNPSQGLRYS